VPVSFQSLFFFNVIIFRDLAKQFLFGIYSNNNHRYKLMIRNFENQRGDWNTLLIQIHNLNFYLMLKVTQIAYDRCGKWYSRSNSKSSKSSSTSRRREMKRRKKRYFKKQSLLIYYCTFKFIY
jgi:hypothetical protein